VSIFGFLLVLVMVLRPQGLIPERRRKLEFTRGIGETELGEPGATWTAVEPGEVVR
jgi:branched-chain amino acid transport system permease protein